MIYIDYMSLSKFTKLSEEEARELLESLRWPDGAICPHCKSNKCTKLGAIPKTNKKKKRRPGVYKCKTCRKQFTITIGTIFEGTKIPLNTWVVAFSLVCSAKKGISALQLSRNLDITYKSAWFMAHRIRYAMKQQPLARVLSGEVEVDETYVGGKPRPLNYGGYITPPKKGRGTKKVPVVALVERNGEVRAYKSEKIDSKSLKKVMVENITSDSTIITDEFRNYKRIVRENFKAHKTVHHRIKQYAKGPTNTNTIESYFSLLKRGVYGAFHHVSKKHLQRYCDEFSYRWNTRKMSDEERTLKALSLAPGKRLVYAID